MTLHLGTWPYPKGWEPWPLSRAPNSMGAKGNPHNLRLDYKGTSYDPRRTCLVISFGTVCWSVLMHRKDISRCVTYAVRCRRVTYACWCTSKDLVIVLPRMSFPASWIAKMNGYCSITYIKNENMYKWQLLRLTYINVPSSCPSAATYSYLCVLSLTRIVSLWTSPVVVGWEAMPVHSGTYFYRFTRGVFIHVLGQAHTSRAERRIQGDISHCLPTYVCFMWNVGSSSTLKYGRTPMFIPWHDPCWAVETSYLSEKIGGSEASKPQNRRA